MAKVEDALTRRDGPEAWESPTIQTYKTLLRLPPGNRTLECAFQYHQATRHLRNGRLLDAIRDYKHLLELDPQDPSVYLELAELYLKTGTTREAAGVLRALGALYRREGMEQAAQEVETRALALEGNGNGVVPRASGLASAMEPAEGPAPAFTPEAQAVRAEDTAPSPASAEELETALPARLSATPPSPTRPADRPPTRPGGPALGKREPLGRILLRMGLVTEEQLEQALAIHERTREKLGRILISMGAITEQDLAKAIGIQWNYPYVALSSAGIDPEVARMVPHHLCIRHKVLPYARNGDKLLVALVDPLNLLALDDVRLITGLDVEPRITTEEELLQAIHKHHQLGSLLEQTAHVEVGPEAPVEEEISLDRLRQMVDEAPVVKLVNLILDQAIREGASDIHIEPYRHGIHVRYRIDGVLHDVLSPPKNLKAALVSRIKIMANLDIAERRRPQDGRIHLRVDGREIDLRVSTLPTMFGEKVVMRILDQSSTLIQLGQLGMASDVQETWERLATKPYGMLLITGPTGSGKTTTLYATLTKINTLEKNIVTIEDPVEYQLPRINQVQVNPKAGLTFATALRSILRQDPDIIMVGEIRDRETAELAVQAALTGHLVFSTLHTNDAASAFTRLLDMGIEPYLVASSVIGVMAQRLARKICSRCKEAYRAPGEAIRRLSEDLAEVEEEVVLYRGAGCEACRHTGYKGRVGVFELLVVSDRIRSLVLTRAPSTEVREAARAEGMRAMREDGLQKVLEGLSTVEEILRVVYSTEV
ncbi:MAG: type II secretion system ATPase GspE [Armatimonadota bacterium]|nr:type II secretion system ATPase GspE [Armatimonadota bacterium]